MTYPAPYFYLATPYSLAPGNLETAHDAACRFAARLIDAGWPIFCPIAHTHNIAKYMTWDPRDSEFWINVNRGPLEAAVGLIVAMLPGWKKSIGIKTEIAAFRKAGKRLIYMPVDGVVPPYDEPWRCWARGEGAG